eukprot:TRINITY_DN3052_c0_g1_i3.p2 TRINITY_DN3052_c0_g1~~TRINITY_DN3052_c0_g1_i3.p2  ORF type:complete len:154 (-),score=35.07 TRINITY_DN3052_c0_g1_i3:114-575(-)
MPLNETYNITHYIKKFSFGAPIFGAINPLDNVTQVDEHMSSCFKYYIKVVPTAYMSLRGASVESNQFSVTESVLLPNKTDERGSIAGFPGIYFIYDIFPIKLVYVEKRTSVFVFFTSIFAVIGGLFTFSGLLDRFIHHSLNSMAKKVELGKQN